MADTVLLRIYDIVGCPVWASTDDGQKVFDKITTAFKAGRSVALSFANHKNMISAFLNASIGQLYGGDYEYDFLEKNLAFIDINEDDLNLLHRTIDNAKRYFSNRQAYDQAWRDAVEDDEE